MGKAKRADAKPKEYTLTVREWDLIKLNNHFLQYHSEKQRLISALLYYICTSRLGYKEDQNLLFELDLEQPDRILRVGIVPDEAIKKAVAKSD